MNLVYIISIVLLCQLVTLTLTYYRVREHKKLLEEGYRLLDERLKSALEIKEAIDAHIQIINQFIAQLNNTKTVTYTTRNDRLN